MVHKKLPESVIVSVAIQAGPSKFNTSPNELIRLNAAGVTENELKTPMVSASGKAGNCALQLPVRGRNPTRVPGYNARVEIADATTRGDTRKFFSRTEA